MIDTRQSPWMFKVQFPTKKRLEHGQALYLFFKRLRCNGLE